jgi:hypothetical protein
MSFDLNSTFHHGECLFGIGLSSIAATEALDGAQGLVFATAAYQPPWRLRGEENEYHEWKLTLSVPVRGFWCVGDTYREDPLQGKRTSPCPLIVALVVLVSGGCDDDTTNRPTHLQCSCTGTTKDKRNNLTGVGRRVCDEQSPWYTFKRLSDDEDLE